ncbi:MAG TPA: hypothetical protein PLL93_15425, partial [bacterium]|nr:hypothetical protein [bacterium]
RAVVQANDGNIIVAGTTASFGAGSNDVFLVKMNLAGALLWQKTYGDQKVSGAYDIQLTKDKGFIISGFMANGITPYDAMLIKISESGEEQWTRTYPKSGKANAKRVIELSDQSFLVTGIAQYSDVPGSNSSFVFHADATGNIIWYQNYNIFVNNESFDMVVLNEQNAVVTGFIDGANTQLYALTVNLSDGIPNGFKRYLDGATSWGYSIIKTENKFWAIGGVIDSDNRTTDVAVIEITLPL